MSGSGQNEVISIKISVPSANAIEGALYVDGISLHGISLPETSLHCTQAPHFLKCLFTVLPEGQIIVQIQVVQAALCCLRLSVHIF